MKSYLKFLSRNGLYTAVNLLGLGVSLAFVLLVGSYLSDEWSVEASNPNKDRIYNFRGENGTTQAAPVAADIEAFFPEVESTLRLMRFRLAASCQDQPKAMISVLMADTTLFDFFPQHFVAGDPRTAIEAMGQAVLTDEYATRTFGSPAEAMGQTIRINEADYMVTGVVRRPARSSMLESDIDAIARFENIRQISPDYIATYGAANFPIFVMLRPGTTIAPDRCDAFAKKLSEYYWLFQDGRNTEVHFMPLLECYWDDQPIGSVRAGNAAFVSVLVLCALLVLVFAATNYINLTVAQTHMRARQSALRRLLGSSPRRVFWGFMAEALAMCSAAMLVAGVIASAAAPWFAETINQPVAFESLFSAANLTAIVVLLVVLSVATGLAPAATAMRFEPIQIVRGDFMRRTKTLYARLMVGFQFAATIVLLGVAFVVGRQTDYMLRAEVGFRKDQLLVVDNTVGGRSLDAFVEAVKRLPGVHRVALSQGAPFISKSTMFATTREGQKMEFRYYAGDSAYIETLGFEVARRTGVRDTAGVWINQTAERKLGVTADATDIPWWEDRNLPLLGVVKDFKLSSLVDPAQEVLIADLRTGLGESYPYEILVRLDASDPQAAKQRVEDAWREFFDGEVFAAYFMDSAIERAYENERRIESQVGLLSVLALAISVMGILAASTYAVRTRRREIALRKVYGSTVGQVVWRLVRFYIVTWACAAAVALPIVWYVGQKWLEGFAYKASIGIELYAGAALAVLFIALATLSLQTLNAARSNPVQSLKTE